jgi:hypothetical protein
MQTFFIGIVGRGVESNLVRSALRPSMGLGDYDGEIGGIMIGRGNLSTRRKPAPVPLCPPRNPHASLTAAVGSQRLTA